MICPACGRGNPTDYTAGYLAGLQQAAAVTYPQLQATEAAERWAAVSPPVQDGVYDVLVNRRQPAEAE